MLPSLTATELTPCWRKKSFISCWTFGFVVTSVATQRLIAAAELARVCRPGGRIALASWTPDGFIGETIRIFSRYLPPAPGLQPPIRWGSPPL
jgi:hypothetical protein